MIDSPPPTGTQTQDDYLPPGESGPRRRLRRARSERMVLGVCAGIARYFDLDPTLVRVGFVLAGLIPPLGGTMLVGYLAMAVIVPEEDAEATQGRAQVQDNLASLRREVSELAERIPGLAERIPGLAERIRARVTGEPTTRQTTAGEEWSGMGQDSEVVMPPDREIVAPRGAIGTGGSVEESHRASPESRVP